MTSTAACACACACACAWCASAHGRPVSLPKHAFDSSGIWYGHQVPRDRLGTTSLAPLPSMTPSQLPIHPSLHMQSSPVLSRRQERLCFITETCLQQALSLVQGVPDSTCLQGSPPAWPDLESRLHCLFDTSHEQLAQLSPGRLHESRAHSSLFCGLQAGFQGAVG